MGHPLAGEGLQFLDGVARGIDQKGADEVQAFVVRDVCDGIGSVAFPAQILE